MVCITGASLNTVFNAVAYHCFSITTKKNMQVKYLLFTILLFFSVGNICSQPPKNRVLFLLDASYSMNKPWKNGTRWQIAKNAIIEIIDSTSSFKNVEFGLRVYGHQQSLRENDCKDSRMELPFGNVNAHTIRKKLSSIQPKGVTPLAYSLEKCANDFLSTHDVSRNFLVIITDGEESCGGEPCAITQSLLLKNIVLKPIVLGIQLPEVLEEKLHCIGELINTNSEQELKTELNRAVMRTTSRTTFQLNILDEKGNATETNVAFSLIDAQTGIDKYHFHHTFNARGLPDTITVSPLFTYHVQLHTLPPVSIKNVMMKEDEHNILHISAPQGYVSFDFNKKINAPDKIKCLIKPCDTCETLAAIAPGGTEKIIIGKYVADILTLPPLVNLPVEVEPRRTTRITIPAPGTITVHKPFEGYGAILLEDSFNIRKVYQLNQTVKPETVHLLPGKYTILYRTKHAKHTSQTVVRKFELKEGENLVLKL
jgi:Ca-activated chloride channel family protein